VASAYRARGAGGGRGARVIAVAGNCFSDGFIRAWLSGSRRQSRAVSFVGRDSHRVAEAASRSPWSVVADRAVLQDDSGDLAEVIELRTGTRICIAADVTDMRRGFPG